LIVRILKRLKNPLERTRAQLRGSAFRLLLACAEDRALLANELAEPLDRRARPGLARCLWHPRDVRPLVCQPLGSCTTCENLVIAFGIGGRGMDHSSGHPVHVAVQGRDP
jgi:hypothetical protein